MQCLGIAQEKALHRTCKTELALQLFSRRPTGVPCALHHGLCYVQ